MEMREEVLLPVSCNKREARYVSTGRANMFSAGLPKTWKKKDKKQIKHTFPCPECFKSQSFSVAKEEKKIFQYLFFLIIFFPLKLDN